MKTETNSIGEYSSSQTGQGCLWVAVIGVIGVIGFSYLSTYAGFSHDPLDRVESGIAGFTRPSPPRRPAALHAHRRQRRHRIVYRSVE